MGSGTLSNETFGDDGFTGSVGAACCFSTAVVEVDDSDGERATKPDSVCETAMFLLGSNFTSARNAINGSTSAAFNLSLVLC